MRVSLPILSRGLPAIVAVVAGLTLTAIMPGVAHADATIGSGTPASCQTNAAANALRTAVEAGGTVDFNCGAAPVTITINGTSVTNKTAIVNGRGLITLDGENLRQFFYVTGTGNLTLNDLILIDGSAGQGGAIYVDPQGVVTVNRTFFTSNQAATNGGAIYNRGVLTINESSFGSNIATGNGAGIYNDGGTVNVRYTYLIANQAGSGGAIYTKGGPLTVENAAFRSGVVTADGSGIYVESNSAQIVNSTFSNNKANRGGGIFSLGTTSLTNVTFNENRADLGGAIYRSGGQTTVKNSIMAGSLAENGAGASLNCDGPTLTSQGGNLVGDNTCVPNPSSVGDLLGTDPQLEIWNNYGGPTRGYMPKPGSPAISLASGCPAVDQRGFARFPGIFGAGCDAGAFEFGSLLYAPLLAKP
jgi:predicted outer membrane repeat protein